jgi:3-oxoadipate CoA-transferase beta subunit
LSTASSKFPDERKNRMPLKRRQIAWRAAQDLADGAYVNLGIGLPTLVADFLPADREIVLHSENGVLGVGPAPGDNEIDWDLINAGKQPVTLVTGGSYVHHTDSFLMIRGGHLDLALLGAFEVSEKGDLANWTTDDPGFPPGVGGAMDLAVGAKEIRVLVEHTTKAGAPRIRRQCGYPLTAAGVVRRIYTDLAVIDVTAGGLVVRELVDDVDFSALQTKTEAILRPAPDIKALRVPAV